MRTRNPIPSDHARSIAASALLLLALLLGPVLAHEAAADNPFRPDRPWIYRTDAVGGAPPYDDFLQVLPRSGTATLRLFITVDGPGDVPNPGSGGQACEVGPTAGRDSDHVCAFNANLQITGPGRFVSFNGNLGAEDGFSTVPDSGSFGPDQKELALVFVSPGSPLQTGTFPAGGVVEIGELVVETSGEVGDPITVVNLVSGEAVRSAALFAIDRSDPSQSMANLSGDAMSAHALAFSIAGDLPDENAYRLGGPAAALQPSNAWGWESGGNLSRYRAAIQDPANFSASGLTTPKIEPAFLSTIDASTLAEIDGFIAPYWADANTPDAVADAIIDFFLAGGDLILLQDEPNFDKIGERLGIPTLPEESQDFVSNGGAPLFAGPFGNATNVLQGGGSEGKLSSADIEARNGNVGATNALGEITAAYWAENQYQRGAGRLLIVADVDMFSNVNANYDPLDANGIFALNGTAYVTQFTFVAAIEDLGRRVIEAGVLPWLPLLIGLGALGSRLRSRG